LPDILKWFEYCLANCLKNQSNVNSGLKLSYSCELQNYIYETVFVDRPVCERTMLLGFAPGIPDISI
jgi:hypothetical protein